MNILLGKGFFTKDAIEELFFESEYHPHPRVRRKMFAVYLKAMGYSDEGVCALCKISRRTLKRYLKAYIKRGIAGLKIFCVQKSRRKLDQYVTSLEEEFRQRPPATVAEAMERIKELTNVELGLTQTREFLLRLGLKPRTVGSFPSKADPMVQQEFLDTNLLPLLEQATAVKRQVFFVDASHFVYGFFSGRLWCFERVFIPTPSGRKRFNVLGALNASTHEIITITNEEYINAKSVIELFKKIRAQYPNAPITLVLDNVPYQKCDPVKESAASLNIDLLYLPPYSPNLNLIERLWKYVKKERLNAKYHCTFSEFKSAIMNCLTAKDEKQRKELASMLAKKFQIFPENPVLSTQEKKTTKRSKKKAA